jgi:hypothetical protein
MTKYIALGSRQRQQWWFEAEYNVQIVGQRIQLPMPTSQRRDIEARHQLSPY